MDSGIRDTIPGFRDITGIEARLKNFISSKIASLFQQFGYDQIIFPLVEKATSFSEEVVGGSPWPEWDKRGVFYLEVPNYGETYDDALPKSEALLVPEGTISVSRWLAKQLVAKKNHESSGSFSFPKKLYYTTPCFRNELISKLSSTKGREFNQVGVEIMGTSNVLADVEIILMAHDGFKALGVPSSQILIRLGSVKIYNALCDESKFDETIRLVLKDKLDTIAESRAGKQPERLQPTYDQVMDIIKNSKLNEATMEKWNIVLNTHVKSLDDASCKILNYPQFTTEINYIAHLSNELNIRNVIDLTVVRSHEYYTGVVYEIDVKVGENVLVEVAGGGRYNRLISKFLAGEEFQIPAVGFAYGLDRVYEIYQAFNPASSKKTVHSVTFWTDDAGVDTVVVSKQQKAHVDDHVRLFTTLMNMRDDRKRIDLYVGDNTNHAIDYAKERQAALVEIE